jgi:hypothetical protein
MFDGLAEKGFGRLPVALRAEHEVHRPTSPINRPVEIRPLAANLQVGLVDTPHCPVGVPKRFQRLTDSGE